MGASSTEIRDRHAKSQRAQIYKGNQFVIARNIESLTHEESLRQPEIEANNQNWILWHIIVGRMRSFSLLGIDPLWREDKIKLYERGSDRVTAATALLLADLEADLNLTMASLTEALSNVDDTALEQTLRRWPHGRPAVAEPGLARNLSRRTNRLPAQIGRQTRRRH